MNKGISYNINVTISKPVAYSKNSTLFVYAQPVNGPTMPIAAIKLPITDFPVQVTLSDANAMMQDAKLSDHKQFVIKAQISEDGRVGKIAGQWAGKSDVIKAGETETINIVINQQL